MDITEVSIIHHVGIVLMLLWLLSSFNYCHPLAYFLSLIYLYLVHDRYAMRFRRKVQFEERRQANQKRVLSDLVTNNYQQSKQAFIKILMKVKVLSDSESVRWLNHTVERIWPVCMEEIVSQKILLPIIPWFLQKYKPWTVKEALVQNLYLGRSPPMFTEMRVCRQSTDDDHLVLELGINFRTADDMSAILAAKMTRRLGFGMWAKMHLTGMHVEGKVLVGVKFLPKWPFLGRLRVCFVEPPYFQMTVKPIFSHGLDVTELPGIAGWLDKLLTLAFEETLVEPNMLVVDVEKFVSPQAENWFSVDAKEPVAYTLVEVVEASDMKPSDMNGLADPYVKGQLGAYRFRTKIQKKTLSPKWQEEFKIPISTWDSPNVLDIEVFDKDRFVDDTLGDCSIKINDLRGGQRHDMWLPLQNIKRGRLRIAIRVVEVDAKVTEQSCDADVSNSEFKKHSSKVTEPSCDGDVSNSEFKKHSSATDTAEFPEKSPRVADNFEPVDFEGQRETGIWVHRPGTEVPQLWEPRKGKSRSGKESESLSSSVKSGSNPNDASSTDESLDGDKSNSRSRMKRGLRKIGSVFHRSPRTENNKSRSFNKKDEENCDLPLQSPHQNVRAVNAKGIGVNLVMEDSLLSPPGQSPKMEGGPESQNTREVKDMAKSIIKHAGNSARKVKHVLSRKGSKKKTEGDLETESVSSCDDSILSQEGQVSPIVGDGNPMFVHSTSTLKSDDVPSPMTSNEAAVDPVIQTDEVKEDDAMDAKAVDKIGVDASGRQVDAIDKSIDVLESPQPKLSEQH